MDLELSDDESALADGLRTMLRARFDTERIRRGFDPSVWSDLAQAGVFSVVGDGFGWSAAAVVFECLGERCVPGPLVAGVLANGHVEGVVTIAEAEADGHAVVEHLGAVDHVVVLSADGIAALAPEALSGSEHEWPLDPLTPVTTVPGLPAGDRLGDGATARQWRERGAVLTAAFASGMCAALTEMAVEYAREREQFDRPIGSFQAIKHILADMLVRTEVARAASYAAAANLDDPEAGSLEQSVATAKLVAVQAAIANGKAATQVFGGMGFTWEVDVHLYLKRAWVLDTHFGSAADHADALGARLPA